MYIQPGDSSQSVKNKYWRRTTIINQLYGTMDTHTQKTEPDTPPSPLSTSSQLTVIKHISLILEMMKLQGVNMIKAL